MNAYDLAKELGVTAPTIYLWVDKGMPYWREIKGLRSSLRFDPKTCRDWLEKQRKEK